MLQSIVRKTAACAVGGALATVAMTGSAMATTVSSAPAKSPVAESAPEGGGRVHTAFVTKRAPIKARPTRTSRTIGHLMPRQTVTVKCKVRGGSVHGNPVWYKLAKRSGWVNDFYVVADASTPRCRFMPRPVHPGLEDSQAPMDESQSSGGFGDSFGEESSNSAGQPVG